MTTYSPSTIAAISTPPGTGGIGIIRISGPRSILSTHRIFRFKHRPLPKPTPFEHRKIYLGHIIDPDSDRIIDEAILFVMKAPHSYTCEDVVEIQLHSSPVILNTILNLLISDGIQLAEPGEFTKRAYLNGRIDLTQAESIVDLIASQTNTAASLAMASLKGDLGNAFKHLKSELIEILSLLDMAIDFPDETVELPAIDTLVNCLNRIINEYVLNLIHSYNEKHIFRDGIKLVIAGSPNVGKSSLMNCLLNKDKSIVTPVPGTTRDIIDDLFILNGTPVIISDTAGIHNTQDPVEMIGVERAKNLLLEADVILLVIDISKGPHEADRIIYPHLKNKNVIVVFNKADLIDEPHTFDLSKFEEGIKHIFVSAKYNQGVTELKGLISSVFHTDTDMSCHSIVPTIRQKIALDFILEHMESAKQSLLDSLPFELAAIDIKTCIDKIGEVTGDNTPIDILDTIFNNFCIGK